MSKTFHVGQVVSLDFVRATKRTIASLQEDLGQVLASQRRLIDRQKELLDLIWQVECDIPVRVLRDGAPVNLADLAAQTGKSEKCMLRERLARELYDVIVKQQKLRALRAILRKCIRMAAKGDFEKMAETIEGANAVMSGGAA
jgi:hypothetical protein